MSSRTVKIELLKHIIETLLYHGSDIDMDELHYHAFQEDYYIVGYVKAEQFITTHNLNVWGIIKTVSDYELNNFDDNITDLADAKSVVSMYVSILGEELLSEFDLDLPYDKVLANIRKGLEKVVGTY